MNDTPRRWLIEVGVQNYVFDGFADAQSAAAHWAKKYGKEDLLRVSEILPGHEINVRIHATAEYK